MTIVKLEPSKHVKERWLCWLEDGSCLRVTENEVVSFALYAGMELTGELYDKLSESAGASVARARALDYIAAKPMSRKELTDKLTAKPPRTKDGRERLPLADEALAGEIADWLEGLGYLPPGGAQAPLGPGPAGERGPGGGHRRLPAEAVQGRPARPG